MSENPLISDHISKFRELKELGDKSIGRLSEEEIIFKPSENSLAVLTIMHHMGGNMISRWTGFPEQDGEKPNRDRDREFEEERQDMSAIFSIWEQGWSELFHSLGKISDRDLMKLTLIRGEALTIHNAIIRQISHLAYHTGQIVYVAKLIKGDHWESLSIPKGKSKQFNESMKRKFPDSSSDSK